MRRPWRGAHKTSPSHLQTPLSKLCITRLESTGRTPAGAFDDNERCHDPRQTGKYRHIETSGGAHSHRLVRAHQEHQLQTNRHRPCTKGTSASQGQHPECNRSPRSGNRSPSSMVLCRTRGATFPTCSTDCRPCSGTRVDRAAKPTQQVTAMCGAFNAVLLQQAHDHVPHISDQSNTHTEDGGLAILLNTDTFLPGTKVQDDRGDHEQDHVGPRSSGCTWSPAQTTSWCTCNSHILHGSLAQRGRQATERCQVAPPAIVRAHGSARRRLRGRRFQHGCQRPHH